MKTIKEDLQNFFELLQETKKVLLKLKKYKGNPNYKGAYLTKVTKINRSFKFLDANITRSTNKRLKLKFKKIRGSIETITKFKIPETSLNEINWIEDFWPEIEILLDSPINKEENSKFKNFHPQIIKVSEKLFNDGHYAQAIEEAFKKIILLVKQKSSRSDLDGCSLMSTVFSKQNPILKFNKNEDQTDLDEQQGWMHLYQGAVLGIRNVKAHKNIIQKDPIKTLEYLSFASLLCRRLDETIKED